MRIGMRAMLVGTLLSACSQPIPAASQGTPRVLPSAPPNTWGVVAMHAARAERFGRLDTNQDGGIDMLEFFKNNVASEADERDSVPPRQDGPDDWSWIQSRFLHRDWNRNGAIDQVEYAGLDPTFEKASSGPVSDPCYEFFKTWDTDRSGTIGYQEYSDAKWQAMRFAQAPMAEEEASIRAGFLADARRNDGNSDGQLADVEFFPLCAEGREANP